MDIELGMVGEGLGDEDFDAALDAFTKKKVAHDAQLVEEKDTTIIDRDATCIDRDTSH